MRVPHLVVAACVVALAAAENPDNPRGLAGRRGDRQGGRDQRVMAEMARLQPADR